MNESDPALLRLPAELAMAAHQLREPLRMIRCYSELLADSGEDPVPCAAVIQENAIRLETLLSGMFECLRLGEFLRLEPVDLNLVLRNAVTRLAEPQRTPIVALPLPRVRGDFEVLTEVFSRLIDNCFKFQRQSPVAIEVRAAVAIAGQWCISVTDNGLGIEAGYEERCFGMFQRLHSKDFAGEGFGLAYCRRAIELHDGRIWLESKPGQGTTVSFTLPPA